MNSSFVILTYMMVANYVEAANILIVIPFTSKSHYIMLRPIGLELSKRGHNVTVITAIKEHNPPPNYHEVVVEYKEIWDVMGTERPVVFDMVYKTFEEFINDVLWKGGLAFNEVAMNSSKFQEFLKADNSYDLIFNEQFFQESFNVLAHKYNAPLVAASTLGNCMKHNFAIGNPLQLNTIILEYLTVRDHTNIWDRLRNIYTTMYEYFWWKHWYLPKQEALVHKYIPDLKGPVPSLFELQKYISILFINTHFSFDTPMALLPNIIEIGGIHTTLENNTSLPQDLHQILDNASEGVVYMNFGSNVRISEMDISKKAAIFNVFRRLKQIVLMKWEEDIIANKPHNVITRKWFPQKDLFAHPNIKVFISHGGLIGTQEATFHGIPILGIPIYADQYNNLDLASKHGFGKILEYHTICEKTFGESLNEMLANKSYKENAERISKRFKDRPLSPLDTTIWWLEYVIRNNGAHFMKSQSMNMSWFKYFMLDIYLTVLTSVTVLIYFVVTVFKIVKILSFYLQSKVRVSKKKRL